MSEIQGAGRLKGHLLILTTARAFISRPIASSTASSYAKTERCGLCQGCCTFEVGGASRTLRGVRVESEGALHSGLRTGGNW